MVSRRGDARLAISACSKCTIDAKPLGDFDDAGLVEWLALEIMPFTPYPM